MLRLCMMTCFVMIAMFVAPGCVSAVGVQTPPTTSSNVLSLTGAARREVIRNMPLLERPNRPGHFYGNTVRWLNSRRTRGF
jgi:hypothetical protein